VLKVDAYAGGVNLLVFMFINDLHVHVSLLQVQVFIDTLAA